MHLLSWLGSFHFCICTFNLIVTLCWLRPRTCSCSSCWRCRSVSIIEAIVMVSMTTRRPWLNVRTLSIIMRRRHYLPVVIRSVSHIWIRWHTPNILTVHAGMQLWLISRILKRIEWICRITTHRDVVNILSIDLTAYCIERWRSWQWSEMRLVASIHFLLVSILHFNIWFQNIRVDWPLKLW